MSPASICVALSRPRRRVSSHILPRPIPTSTKVPHGKKKGIRRQSGFPLRIAMVPKGGLEPPRVSPPPPQDGVSTRFHHFGTRGKIILSTRDAKIKRNAEQIKAAPSAHLDLPFHAMLGVSLDGAEEVVYPLLRGHQEPLQRLPRVHLQ